MNFRVKIFLSLMVVGLFLSLFILTSTYYFVKKNITDEFFSRYQSLGNVVSNMFRQMGNMSDQANKNAVSVLKNVVKYQGIPSNRKLAKLAYELGIQGFYVINREGKFVRSSDIPLQMQKNSLFSYCAGYRELVHGHLDNTVTPIIPSYPYGIPSKFIMIPSENRALILESGIHLSYIGEILHHSIQYNKNIISIGLFSPNGYTLGFISEHGKFTQGKDILPVKTLSGTYLKNHTVVLNFRIPSSIDYCCECKIKGVQNTSINSGYYYILQMTVSLSPLLDDLLHIKTVFVLLFLLAAFFSFIISSPLSNMLVARIKKMNRVIGDIMTTGELNNTVPTGKMKDEISVLADNFNKMVSKLDYFRKIEIEYEKTKEIKKISKQVAHDIRSPLTALDMVTKRLPKMADALWVILRDSINHIRDIANNLDKGHTTQSVIQSCARIQIAVLLDSVISERRIAYSNKKIKLSYDFSAETYAFFVDVIPLEMRRILTNLINNAFEACHANQHTIFVLLHKQNNVVVMTIRDDGSGISKTVLHSLFTRGFSTKKNGSGLGLVHAKDNVESWGGSIVVVPNVTQGTSVSIALPLQLPPKWFLKTLLLSENSDVICVDDSSEIYHAWKERIGSVNKTIAVKFCDSRESLSKNISMPSDQIRTYLVDYEFTGKNYNGIDLIKMILSHPPQHYRIFLVTSRSDELFIQQFCEDNNIKMILKSFAFKIALVVQ